MRRVFQSTPVLLLSVLGGCDIAGTVIEARRHEAGTLMQNIMAATDQCDNAISAKRTPGGEVSDAQAFAVCRQAYDKYPNAPIVQIAYGIETMERGGKSGHGDPDVHAAGVRLLTNAILSMRSKDDVFYMAVQAAGATNHLLEQLIYVNACESLATYHWPGDPECNPSQVAQAKDVLNHRNDEAVQEYHEIQAGYIPKYVPTGGSGASNLGIELGEHEQLMHGFGDY